jgi:hypothetical protein
VECQYAREAMLRLVHASSYAALDKQLTELAEDLSQREVSTHFIPLEMKTQEQALSAKVTGYLEPIRKLSNNLSQSSYHSSNCSNFDVCFG